MQQLLDKLEIKAHSSKKPIFSNAAQDEVNNPLPVLVPQAAKQVPEHPQDGGWTRRSLQDRDGASVRSLVPLQTKCP